MSSQQDDKTVRQMADMMTLTKVTSYGLEESLKLGTHDVNISFQLKRVNPFDFQRQDHGFGLVVKWRLEDSKDLRSYLASRTDYHVSQRCILCHKNASIGFKCDKACCRSGLYCSDECRTLDRPRHADLCKPMMSSFADFNRPTKAHRRAFMFAPDELKPQPIWLKCEFSAVTGMISIKFDQETVLRWASERSDQEITTWLNPCGGQHTVYTIGQGHGVLLFGLKQAANSKPENINRSIAALAKPGHLVPEFGPVFVVRHYVQGIDMAFQCFGDASLRDLQHGIDNILASSCNTTVSNVSRHRYRTMPAIKFNDLTSPWTKAMGVTEELQMVRVRLVGGMMPSYVLLFPKKVGIFWLITPTAVPDGAKADHFLANVPLLWRWILIDPHNATAAELSDSALKIHGCVARRLPVFGSFIVHDAYGRPIRKEHIEALNGYVEANKPKKGGIADLQLPISKEGFEAFWETYKASLVKEVPSPWDKRLEKGAYVLPAAKEVHKLDVAQLRELEAMVPK